MPDKPRGKPVRSYKTSFPRDEDPISEDGMWLNGRKDGIDWIDVVSRNGEAYGQVSRMTVAERRIEQGNLEASTPEEAAPIGDYDDPTAVLAGAWGRNQHAKARVFSRNQTEEYFQEVEIRLRSSITPHSCTGYEVFWRCLKTENAYAEIVRWNGKIGDFTSLRKLIGAQYGVKDGDVIEATVVGNVLKGFINGVEVIAATDDVFDSGSPGIGFNFFVGNTNVDHGVTYFEVDTYDD
jgi:predicted RNA-binding protein